MVQTVLLFGAETRVLLAEFSKNMETLHVGFLRQVAVNTAKRQRGGTWISTKAASVLKETRTQTLGAYIDKRQATVVGWVVLRLILNICNRETGYEGGGRRRDTWWRLTPDRKQLSAALEDILWCQGNGIENP